MESFNGKLRDELLDRKIFYTLQEVQVLTEQYRQTYNRIRATQLIGLQASRTGGYGGEFTADQREHCAHDRGCTNIRSGTTIGGRSRATSCTMAARCLAVVHTLTMSSLSFSSISR